jgi:RNA polymerase sigma-70 factor (ECF subfamily)
MTAQQVAETEGIPLGTAKTRIRDGMRKLRAAFLPDGTGQPGETGFPDEAGLPEETGDE